jgi:hypothetical protein
MKYQTSELIGWRLDQAVAKAMGFGYDVAKSSMVVLTLSTGKSATDEGCTIIRNGKLEHYAPSTKWEHGGPILQQEGISPERHKPDSMDAGDPLVSDGRWMWVTDTGCGPTMLVAAMREFVSRKFGDEVDL